MPRELCANVKPRLLRLSVTLVPYQFWAVPLDINMGAKITKGIRESVNQIGVRAEPCQTSLTTIHVRLVEFL